MASNYKLTVDKDGMLTYEYETRGGDLKFRFNLLCEVGEPYQPWFRAEIQRRNLNVDTRELDVPPWVADFATTRGMDGSLMGFLAKEFECEGKSADDLVAVVQRRLDMATTCGVSFSVVEGGQG